MTADIFDLKLFEDVLDTKLEAGELEAGQIKTDEGLSKPTGGSGISETPGSKPYDSTGGTGISEKPSGTPYDSMSLSIPGVKEIPHSAYTQIVSTYQKSMKETAELAEMLSKLVPVAHTVESLQEAHTRDAIDDAMYESYISGPLFEAVTKSDKAPIRKIISRIGSRVDGALPGSARFIQPRRVLRWLFEPSIPSMVGIPIPSLAVIQIVENIIKARLWQTVGLVYCDKGADSIKEVLDKLNEEFKEDLGDYKLIAMKITPALIDLLRGAKFGGTHILVVDTAPPKDMEKLNSAGLVRDLKKEIKEKKAAKEGDGKDVKKESAEFDTLLTTLESYDEETGDPKTS